jgi:hypothetical protein
LIQCPQCNRTGDIADRFGLARHKVRCRACDARFWTVPLSAKEGIDRLGTPIGESSETWGVGKRAPFPYMAPVSASLDDDEESTFDSLDPGDSHYELTVASDDENDDSQGEVPAYTSGDAPSSDEIAVFADDPPSAGNLITDPRYSNPIDPWGRYRIAGTVIAGALSLAILGFFVSQGILNAQKVSSSITAFIAGCIGLGGLLLLLLSLPRSPLHSLLGELAKVLRRTSRRSDIDSQIASE